MAYPGQASWQVPKGVGPRGVVYHWPCTDRSNLCRCGKCVNCGRKGGLGAPQENSNLTPPEIVSGAITGWNLQPNLASVPQWRQCHQVLLGGV